MIGSVCCGVETEAYCVAFGSCWLRDWDDGDESGVVYVVVFVDGAVVC